MKTQRAKKVRTYVGLLELAGKRFYATAETPRAAAEQTFKEARYLLPASVWENRLYVGIDVFDVTGCRDWHFHRFREGGDSYVRYGRKNEIIAPCAFEEFDIV